MKATGLWHRLVHAHTPVDKPDVGRIVLCTSRLSGRIRCAHVHVGRASWHLPTPNDRQLRKLAAAPTSASLALTAWQMEVSQP